MSVNANRDAKGPSKTKICQLDGSVFVDQEVLGLKIAVENTSLVTEQHCLQHLVGVTFDQVLVHHLLWTDRIQVLFQVHLKELKDQIQSALLHDDINEADNVGMVELLEQRHLPDSGGWNSFLLRLEADLFHCHRLTGLLVLAL